MKYLILLLLPLTVMANGNHSENSHGGDHSTGSTGGIGGVADSTSSSNVVIINGTNPDSSGISGINGEADEAPYRNIKVDYDNIPANSAPNLSVAYCVEGLSGQGRVGGLSIGGAESVCRQTRMIGAALPEVERLKAKGDAERAEKLSEDITLTVERMFEDEKGRRIADKSMSWFKTVAGWVLLAILASD